MNGSVFMPFSPIKHPIVYIAFPFKEILQHPSQPTVIGLLLELKRPHIFEILYEFLCIVKYIPGNPSHSNSIGTDIFFSLISSSESSESPGS